MKKLKDKIECNQNYGAGEGTTETIIYECQCGNGEIREIHDNVPGFRDHDVIMSCDICSQTWDIDISKGVKNWKLVKKQDK